MRTLNFKNLTIKYNEEELSKSTIKNVKTVEGVGMFVLVIVLLAVIWVSAFYIDIVTTAVVTIIIVVGGGLLLEKVIDKISPRHYKFITWLMKFKPEEIEVGWLNSRFIVEMWNPRYGWTKNEFGEFIDENYRLSDVSDKSKPIHMTIDLTNKDINVLVGNK